MRTEGVQGDVNRQCEKLRPGWETVPGFLFLPGVVPRPSRQGPLVLHQISPSVQGTRAARFFKAHGLARIKSWSPPRRESGR